MTFMLQHTLGLLQNRVVREIIFYRMPEVEIEIVIFAFASSSNRN